MDPVARTPLFQYALGACDASHAARLSALRASDADFVDADYPFGRYALEDPVNPDAEESLRAVRVSVACVSTLPGRSRHASATCTGCGKTGHRRSSRTMPRLTSRPTHPEATIGRTISLSRLERSEEAIAAATRLIDEGQWLLGEAYYWRGVESSAAE